MKRKFLMKIMMTLLVIFVITVSPVLAMSYSYDDLGRLTSVTYDSGQNTTYSYDSAGNMLSTTNSLGNKLITSYSLAAQTGPAIIDSLHQTVAITVNNGTDVTNLVTTFTLSDESSNAQVGSTAQVSGTTSNDFTTPVIYKVTAADGSEQDWTVTVTTAAVVPAAAPTSEALTVRNPSGTIFTLALHPTLMQVIRAFTQPPSIPILN
jgi:YD repeat-containing protein